MKYSLSDCLLFMFKNPLFFVLLVIFSTSCSSTNKTNDATIENTTNSLTKNWLGTWERNSWQLEASLEIKTIKNDSIFFSISATNGGNSGGVDGIALVSKNIATYLNTEDGDTCIILFTLLVNSVISVEQQKGFCLAGVGVEYSGKYINSKFNTNKSKTTSLFKLEIFDSIEQDSVFKDLVGDKYDLFVNSTQLTSDSDDLDSLQTTVRASGVRGMFTYMENIIMIDDSNTIWAAVIDDNSVYYFTNSDQYKNTLPKTINEWREGFKDYEVVFNKKAD